MRIVIGAGGSLSSAVCQGYKERGIAFIGTNTKGSDNLLALDFTDRKSIEAFADKIDTVNHLVISAGRERQSSLMELEEDDFDKMIAIHNAGPLWLVKQLHAKFSSQACMLFALL